MSADPFQARQILEDALELPTNRQRELVQVRCAGDTELFGLVLRYLEAHQNLDEKNPVTELGPDTCFLTYGPYRATHLIARGGIGAVYKATDTRSDRAVALKVLLPQLQVWGSVTRFRREFEAVSRLDHDGIVKVFDLGIENQEGREIPYLAMEWIDGVNLRRWTEKAAPTFADRLRVLREVCEAVGHAHGRGVVHRDLKPENILVASSGRACVLDFGIASLGQSSDNLTRVTKGQFPAGTPDYMSPEQFRGESGPPADVFALGIVGYELMTDALPHPNGTADASSDPDQVPVLAGDRVTEVRGDLELVLECALEVSTGRRYTDAAAMALDLRRVENGERIPRTLQRRIRALCLRSRTLHWLSRRGPVLLLALSLGTMLALLLRQGGDGLDERAEIAITQARNVIMDATHELHEQPRKEERILILLPRLEAARDGLEPYRKHGWARLLSRLVQWRLGEACYFMHGLTYDPNWLREAAKHWDRTSEIPPPSPDAFETLGGDDQLKGIYRHLGRHHPRMGLGLAHVSLVQHDAPAHHARLALNSRQEGVRRIRGDLGPNYIEPRSERQALADSALAFNEMGEAWRVVGDLAGGAEEYEKSLYWARKALSIHVLQLNRTAHASALQNAGILFTRLAQQSRNPALLDSADVYFEQALQLRSEASISAVHWETRLERARLQVERAKFLQDRDGAEVAAPALDVNEPAAVSESECPVDDRDLRALLEQAVEEVAIARLTTHHPFAQCLVLGVEAQIRIEQGTMVDTSYWQLAEENIREVAKYMTLDERPIQHCEVLLLSADLESRRYGATRNSNHCRNVRSLLKSARSVVPRQDFPSLYRRAESIEAQCGSVR